MVTAAEGHIDRTVRREVGTKNAAVMSGIVSMEYYAKMSICPVKCTAHTPDGDVVG